MLYLVEATKPEGTGFKTIKKFLTRATSAEEAIRNTHKENEYETEFESPLFPPGCILFAMPVEFERLVYEL